MLRSWDHYTLKDDGWRSWHWSQRGCSAWSCQALASSRTLAIHRINQGRLHYSSTGSHFKTISFEFYIHIRSWSERFFVIFLYVPRFMLIALFVFMFTSIILTCVGYFHFFIVGMYLFIYLIGRDLHYYLLLSDFAHWLRMPFCFWICHARHFIIVQIW